MDMPTGTKNVNVIKCFEDIYPGCYGFLHIGAVDVISFLVRIHHIVPYDMGLLLTLAATNGNEPVVRFLVDYGADIHMFDDDAFISAAMNGHMSIINFLISVGANIHARDDDALRWAAWNGYMSLVELLVEKGADIHACNDEALRNARERGYVNIIGFLEGLYDRV